MMELGTGASPLPVHHPRLGTEGALNNLKAFEEGRGGMS